MSANAKVKTSVTLPKDLLAAVDQFRGEHASRSELIESVLRSFVAKKKRQQQCLRDIEIINLNAERLNREALETLEYQVEW